MNTIDAVHKLREILASLDPAASHTVIGESSPKVDEIYAPASHAGALDPQVTLVLGARGSGKSFWAGVLGKEETLFEAAKSYPRLGLEKLKVKFGFIGQEGSGSISKDTIDAIIPEGEEKNAGFLWRAVVMRAVSEVVHGGKRKKIKELYQKCKDDSEEWEEELRELDDYLVEKSNIVLIIFDAMDALAYEHNRLEKLLDSLFKVAWSMKSYKAIRLKLFLRHDQISQLNFRFVELPKLRAGETHLVWRGVDLYGMLFLRLYEKNREAMKALLVDTNTNERILRTFNNEQTQAALFVKFAGDYMGSNKNKGKTYSWPINHLGDGHREVTPRSFLALMIQAAKYHPSSDKLVMSPEGIRNGLRKASEIRVEQLALEFPWIKRVLIPLARLQVPCGMDNILSRWEETGTLEAIKKIHAKQSFMLPFESNDKSEAYGELLNTLRVVGVLIERNDGRYDMPDLFRVAARLLKKGGVSPVA